ncbi:MAG: ATP-dependent DNA ligase [Nitriliruptoraceae bacterium]|nr:ATP-dependent DNA ligase [Nitriliruptoraceae bacterium]
MVLEVDDCEVRISSPDKPYFPEVGLTKLDVVEHYRRVAPLLLPHVQGRPCNLERFPDGVGGTSFVQKRLPASRPDWLATADVTFGSGRTATELCPASLADVLWSVNLGAITVHPWSVRQAWFSPLDPDGLFDEPDELRIDLDPAPEVGFDAVRRVAVVVGEVLDEHGITGYPKTSGASGIHVLVRIERRSYVEVRAAAVALAREVERRLPDLATSAWWKEERGARVFLDYNQNLWDRTTAAAYAVRPVADARVSLPVTWAEVVDVEPQDATITTLPALIGERDDPMAGLDRATSSLDGLLGLAAADHADGLGDLPLPPHYPKLPHEPPRVPPSRRRATD